MKNLNSEIFAYNISLLSFRQDLKYIDIKNKFQKCLNCNNLGECCEAIDGCNYTHETKI